MSIVLSFFIMFFFLLLFFYNVMFKFVTIKILLSEWDFLMINFNLDLSTLIFMFLLILVFSSILIFSCYYMEGEKYFTYYLWTMAVFVVSMIILLISKSLLMMFIGWDLLGISSFLLVNFYGSWDSINSSMNTVMSNRVGDFFLFMMSLSLFYMSFLSENYYLMSVFLILILLMTAFTKSAQYPFSGWLPKAMAAPTPVSSLVHSSTLVTAGLLLISKMENSIMTSFTLSVLFWVGLLTLFIASLSAFIEEDVKKVVALSTLSQMGLATLTMGLGLIHLSFLHLISHGFFKSLLFMQVGYLMHQASSEQDPRNYMFSSRVSLFVQLQLLVSLFSLCGLFFTNGLVTKDLILELFWINNWTVLVILLFFISILLTFFYSFRLWKSLFMSSYWSVSSSQLSLLFKFNSLMLVLSSVMFIWWVNLNLLSIPSFFVHSDFYTPMLYLILFLLMMNYLSNFKYSMIISKFYIDYYLLNSRWTLLNFKGLEMLAYKLDNSLILNMLMLSHNMINLLLTNKSSWFILIMFMFFYLW